MNRIFAAAAVSLLASPLFALPNPSPQLSAEAWCKNVKESKKQCIATRLLVAQLKSGDRNAKWSDDIDPLYADEREAKMLFEFMLRSIPFTA